MALKLLLEGRGHSVEIVRRRPHLVLSIDGREHEIAVAGDVGDGRRTIEIDGDPIHLARAQVGDSQVIHLDGRAYEVGWVDPRSEIAESGAGHDAVMASMPGRVVSVSKMVGDLVSRGETVATIESMKLQMALTSPRDGRIGSLHKAEGDAVEKDEAVARLEVLSAGG